MTAPWFHVAHVPHVDSFVELDTREARHATGAKRLREGDALCLFDGTGVIADGRIAAPDGSRALRVRIEQRREHAAPVPAIHLAVALPKGDRQSTLLSMVTQLGAASITPLACARSVAQATEKFTDRAERVCLEACKQSHRAHAPTIGPSCPPEVAASRPNAFIAHPGGLPIPTMIETVAAPGVAAVHVLVGPEGGFTDDEVDRACSAGATRLDLGSGILRIETAAVAVIAALRLTLGDRSLATG